MDNKVLNEAVEQLNKKNYHEARILFLSISDENLKAQYYLGAIYRMGLGVIDDQKEAFDWFLKAAKKGHNESQYLVGCAYIEWESYHLKETELVINDYDRLQKQSDNDLSIWQDFYPYYKLRGVGVEPNNDKGVMWIKRAATKGYGNAQLTLGDIYDIGIGVKEDKKLARLWYNKAKSNGSVVALRRLANYSFNYEEDFSKGINLLKKAHELGDNRSSFNLGKRYEKSGNIKEAFKWYLISAQRFNYFESQMKLGEIYYEGNTVEVDIVESITWYRKAIESYRNSHSSGYIGNVYEKLQEIKDLGYEDVITDYEIIALLKEMDDRLELRKFYNKGYNLGKKYNLLFESLEKAEQGDKQAQIEYGYTYKIGSARDKQEKEMAIGWYMENAARGDKDSQYLLSKIYYGDYYMTERLFWLKKAADNGHCRAQFEYAIFLENKQPIESNKYMEKAAKSNVDAQIILGYAYAHGGVVNRDYKIAFSLYQQAAANMRKIEDIEELRWINYAKFHYNAANDEAKSLALANDLDAQLYMGCLYQYGFEVKRDYDKSLSWYELAKKQGSKEAQTQLEILKRDQK